MMKKMHTGSYAEERDGWRSFAGSLLRFALDEEQALSARLETLEKLIALQKKSFEELCGPEKARALEEKLDEKIYSYTAALSACKRYSSREALVLRAFVYISLKKEQKFCLEKKETVKDFLEGPRGGKLLLGVDLEKARHTAEELYAEKDRSKQIKRCGGLYGVAFRKNEMSALSSRGIPADEKFTDLESAAAYKNRMKLKAEAFAEEDKALKKLKSLS